MLHFLLLFWATSTTEVMHWPKTKTEYIWYQVGGIVVSSRMVCQIFDFAKCAQSKVVVCIFHSSEFTQLTFCQIVWAGLADQGVLNKVPTVCQMKLDLPTPVSHSHEMHLQCLMAYPPQKYICKYLKKQNLVISLFYIKNRESVWQTRFWYQWVFQMQNLPFLPVLQLTM